MISCGLYYLHCIAQQDNSNTSLYFTSILATIYPITILLRVNVFDAQSCNEDLRRIEAVAKTDVEGDTLDQLETCPTCRQIQRPPGGRC